MRGNGFLTIPEALDAVNTRTILLLTTVVKTLKLILVNRETMDPKIKRLFGHPTGYRARGHAVGWKYIDSKNRSSPDRIYGHSKDKGYRA